ncbi:hypothetical protein SADUNF_Sadunf18G0117700 [Salix dunnii]|uniref:Uncharacterized protein n=1 Tax=Salix dunnii TaxID=1413687 RepID=A0A835J5Q4_9ROSI|nr:hypothetical protein SADUNF_Sadunf18G0117700 [Salix dunnii]
MTASMVGHPLASDVATLKCTCGICMGVHRDRGICAFGSSLSVFGHSCKAQGYQGNEKGKEAEIVMVEYQKSEVRGQKPCTNPTHQIPTIKEVAAQGKAYTEGSQSVA